MRAVPLLEPLELGVACVWLAGIFFGILVGNKL